MKTKEKISIEEFDGKRFKIRLVEPDNNRKAVITHYLHNIENGSAKYYKKAALKYIKEYCETDITCNDITEAAEMAVLQLRLEVDKPPFPTPENYKFKFIDLFAGIGGFRIAMQQLGGKCVFSSEWDKEAQKTYFSNFGEYPFGDITLENTKKFIPKKFDILCGGFPCQPFSLAGVTKKNSLGKKHGFDDEKQGNLFFHIAEIIETHRPKVFFLENVKNLVSHDKGNTFKVIKETLTNLGYSFHFKVMDGKYYVPQHRERTFMVGFDTKIFKNKEKFDFPILPDNRIYELKDIIDDSVDNKYTLSNHLWNYLFEYAKKHKEKGNGFGYGLFDKNKDTVTRTISARYHKDGAEVLIKQIEKNPRRLTPRECARLQGYPENFVIPNNVSDTQAYRQFGNSVVVPIIQALGKNIIDVIVK